MKKKQIKKPSKYVLTLEVNGKTQGVAGDNLEEMILSLKPDKPHTKALFILNEEGKPPRKTYLFIWQLNRLFGQSLSGEMQRTVLIIRLTL